MKFIRDKNICNLPKIYNLTQKTNVLPESSEYIISKWKQYIGNPSEKIRSEKIPRVHLEEMEDFNDTGITQAV